MFDASGNVVTWTYDEIYQLTSELREGPSIIDWVAFTLSDWENLSLSDWELMELNPRSSDLEIGYAYDPVGNRLVHAVGSELTTYVYDGANQLATSQDASGTTTYAYDGAGNLLGSAAPGGVTTHTWSADNRQLTAELPDSYVVTNTYRADGLRHQKTDVGGTIRFVYDGKAYLAETDGGNVLRAIYASEPAEFGGLISQWRKSGLLWLPSYYHFDAVGSTRGLTDEGEGLVAFYPATAFGEQFTGGAVVNPFRFVGRLGYYDDQEAGQSQVRERAYDPKLGRWLGADPARSDGNLYRYVGNSPMRGVDPSGLEGWWPDYLEGEEGLWPDYLEGKEGLVPDFLWGETSPYGQAVRGLGTGSKAIVNAATKTTVSTVTLGYSQRGEIWAVTDWDRSVGYEWSEGAGRISGEIGVGLLTGGMSQAGKAGKVVAYWDAAGNLVAVGEGTRDAIENGVSLNAGVQIVGGGLGMGGQLRRKGMQIQNAPSTNYELYKAIRAQGYSASDTFKLMKSEQPLLWHYTRRVDKFSGDTITAGAAGRIWATTHAPTGWHESKSFGGWIQRIAYTGRGDAVTDVKLISGAVRDDFAPVFAIGPARGWKRLGGQYSTTRPGDWNLSMDRIVYPTKAQSRDFRSDNLTYQAVDVSFWVIAGGAGGYLMYDYNAQP